MMNSIVHASLTRKQFLLVLLSLAAGLTGIKQLLQQTRSSRRTEASGFSRGTYGGR